MKSMAFRLASFWRHVRALGRVLLLVGLVQLVGLAVLARSASANARETLLQLSHWLRELPGVVANTPTELWLNSARFTLASGTSALSPTALLDQLEHHCGENAGVGIPQRALSQLAAETADSPLPSALPNARGVFRSQDGDEGIVLCFAHEADETSLAERLGALAETGDLSELGELRYFWVQGSEAGRSVFLSVSSRGSLRLFDLFPASGDAPGEDLREFPRPEDGRRTLSAGVPGMGRLASYELQGAEGAIRQRYQEQLVQSGWTARPVGTEANSLLAVRAGRTVLITVVPLPTQPGNAQVTVAEL